MNIIFKYIHHEWSVLSSKITFPLIYKIVNVDFHSQTTIFIILQTHAFVQERSKRKNKLVENATLLLWIPYPYFFVDQITQKENAEY